MFRVMAGPRLHTHGQTRLRRGFYAAAGSTSVEYFDLNCVTLSALSLRRCLWTYIYKVADEVRSALALFERAPSWRPQVVSGNPSRKALLNSPNLLGYS